MNRKSLLVFFLFLPLLSACGSVIPQLRVQTFGEVNSQADKAIEETAVHIQEPPEDVRIVSGSLPEGLGLSEQGAKITVQPGYESRYEVLGSVNANFNAGSNFRNIYWVNKYPREKDNWRKYLCAPQAPLRLLTLGIWNLVPTAWPCMNTGYDDERERQDVLTAELARGVKAMGGNLLVISSSGATDITYIQDGRTVGASTIHMTALGGFAVKEK